jgi:replication-associated recombination protein RarA
MTANDISKFHAALTSRCMALRFDPLPTHDVLTRLCDRYDRRLRELGYVVDRARLEEIVSHGFPDLREIANRLEFEFPKDEPAILRTKKRRSGGASPQR